MSSYFEFNGVKSSDMGLVIERVRPLYSPKKKITTHQVPGRSGDLHTWDGSFENYPISYRCWFKKPSHYENMALLTHEILEWLSSAPMGAELRDSYDEMVTRKASYIGGAEIENIRNVYGRFTITFDCDPRAFIFSDSEYEARKDFPAVLINHTPFPAKPLIEVTGAISGSVVVGNTTITIVFRSYERSTIIIDCELQEAWAIVDGVAVSQNQYIGLQNWPIIGPGTTEVEVTGGIESAVIKPRWWTL